MKDNIIIFLLACMGGFLFFTIHSPLPWTLGPLVITLLWKTLRKKSVYWPRPIRNTGLIFLGYAMGSPFTIQVGHQILGQLPGMLMATFATMTISLLVGWFTSRRTGVGIINGLIGSVPGGLSQMAVICEEIDGADVAVVTLMQITRVLTVVFIVPMLAIYGLSNNSTPIPLFAANAPLNYAAFLPFVVVCILSPQLAKLLKVPTPYLMGPTLGTISLIIGGYDAPHLPQYLTALAQIAIGIRMGADITFDGLKNWKSIVLYTFGGVLLVITMSLGVDYALTKFYSISFLTAFISTAPGGITEMGLTAMTVHADVSLVVAYQLFRLLSMLILGIPVIRWWLMRRAVRNVVETNI
ncbi:AbrB family transcriptional regulator [Pelosinus sp. UFO1]|uniref:AbrB family transcriptional regulator n=1 Tax=Pelosinus sp. UFO1 TaxID=484770 RepID=UPI0004D13A4E|nr:AbrB family transcriptional regulator [Pelosinus sp. UFO1]AIF53269.1 membrane protein AbrB duplication [Pelosinus sp. UFO1]